MQPILDFFAKLTSHEAVAICLLTALFCTYSLSNAPPELQPALSGNLSELRLRDGVLVLAHVSAWALFWGTTFVVAQKIDMGVKSICRKIGDWWSSRIARERADDELKRVYGSVDANEKVVLRTFIDNGIRQIPYSAFFGAEIESRMSSDCVGGTAEAIRRLADRGYLAVEEKPYFGNGRLVRLHDPHFAVLSQKPELVGSAAKSRAVVD